MREFNNLIKSGRTHLKAFPGGTVKQLNLVSKKFRKEAGADLRRSIAEIARMLCTREVKIKVSPNENSRYMNLEAYTACRLSIKVLGYDRFVLARFFVE